MGLALLPFLGTEWNVAIDLACCMHLMNSYLACGIGTQRKQSWRNGTGPPEGRTEAQHFSRILLPVLPPAIQTSSVPREFCRAELHLSTMSGSSVRSAAGQEAPAAKKQRKFTEAELGGPIEDEEMAREKLKEAEFDPEDIHEVKDVSCPSGVISRWDVNPICHFAGAGDLKMCRYLITRGATTRDVASVEYDDGEVSDCFPMYAAAQYGAKAVCQWLYHHGAHSDISRVGRSGECPLSRALFPWSHPTDPTRDLETAQWLILHGAIPEDKEGNLCAPFMRKAFRMFGNIAHGSYQEGIERRKRLLQWAETVCVDHAAYTTFLHGTLSRPSDKEEKPLSSSLSLARFLGGHEDLRKKIAEYVGVMTGRNLRTIQGIVEPLKNALEQAEKS